MTVNTTVPRHDSGRLQNQQLTARLPNVDVVRLRAMFSLLVLIYTMSMMSKLRMSSPLGQRKSLISWTVPDPKEIRFSLTPDAAQIAAPASLQKACSMAERVIETRCYGVLEGCCRRLSSADHRMLSKLSGGTYFGQV